jgi:hypothetical protein
VSAAEIAVCEVVVAVLVAVLAGAPIADADEGKDLGGSNVAWCATGMSELFDMRLNPTTLISGGAAACRPTDSVEATS